MKDVSKMSDRELRQEVLKLRSAIIEADEALMCSLKMHLTDCLIEPAFGGSTGCPETINEVLGL